MVCKKSELRNIVIDFVRRIKKKMPVEKVIIFGSYAYGKPNRSSDLDLAIISSKFKRMNEVRRIMFLSDIARHVKTPYLIDIDPLGFTEEEINNADYFALAGEIKEKGKIIYSR
jgi:predicted nucleotidyltransferase